MNDMAESMARVEKRAPFDDNDYDYQPLPTIVEGVEKNLENLQEHLSILAGKMAPILRPETNDCAEKAVMDMRSGDCSLADQIRNLDHIVRRVVTYTSELTQRVQL